MGSKVVFVCFLALLNAVTGFVPSSSTVVPASSLTQAPLAVEQPTTTALASRRWNFNEGQSPWGLKKNAETWNGRVAQMAFAVVFLQELIQGKGVIKGIQEGDPVNLVLLGAVVVSTVGLTIWLAIQGDDDYMSQDL